MREGQDLSAQFLLLHGLEGDLGRGAQGLSLSFSIYEMEGCNQDGRECL